MCEDVVFAFSSNTLEGYPIIGACICDIMYKEKVLNIFSKIDEIYLDIDEIGNAYKIDYLLKEKIAKISPDYIIGLALSINVPNAAGPTGGIIGNPFFRGKTADGAVDNIGNGYCVAALPGGPGLLIKSDESTSKNIFANIVIGENKLISCNKIVREFENNNINIAIVVKDGTGKTEDGMILTYYYGKIEHIRINKTSKDK